MGRSPNNPFLFLGVGWTLTNSLTRERVATARTSVGALPGSLGQKRGCLCDRNGPFTVDSTGLLLPPCTRRGRHIERRRLHCTSTYSTLFRGCCSSSAFRSDHLAEGFSPCFLRSPTMYKYDYRSANPNQIGFKRTVNEPPRNRPTVGKGGKPSVHTKYVGGGKGSSRE